MFPIKRVVKSKVQSLALLVHNLALIGTRVSCCVVLCQKSRAIKDFLDRLRLLKKGTIKAKIV